MFDDLQKRLSTAFGRFRARGLLTEANIADGLREVRSALLEADVNLQVVQDFMAKVNEAAVGAQLIKAVRPDQQVVKIVHDAMIGMMGPVDPAIRFEKSWPHDPDALRPPGLGQDDDLRQARPMARRSGSQTAARRRRPPAARRRRAVEGHRRSTRHPRLQPRPTPTRSRSARRPWSRPTARAATRSCSTPPAGLHIDDDLMAELKQIEKKVRPHHVYFVCDALTGQDAVASASAFNAALELDGVILTKLDGDARGGAALSVKHVTGVPIKFVGMGEKLDKLQPFDPERIVGQILGMGDIVGLVEAAQSAVDEDEARRQQEKLAKGKFDLDDFRQQLTQMKKMGSVKDLMGMIPGMNQMAGGLEGVDADNEVKRIQGHHRQHDQGRAPRPSS